MKITDVAKIRYSTKKFDAARVLTTEQLGELKDLLRLSASSVNSQPWHFVIAQTSAGKARVAKAAQGQYVANESKILQAPVSVVFCVKTDFTDQYIAQLNDQEEADGRIADAEMKAKVLKVRTFYADLHRKDWGDIQCWMEKQVYLNMGAFLLGVGAMGLDAVPIEGVDCAVLDAEFDLNAQGFKALAVVSVGYKDPDDFNAKLPKSRWPDVKILTEV
jgi:nitroreductase/dihydropteridine reductase